MKNKVAINANHYIFTVNKDSLAHDDINTIIEVQENAFNKITQQLGFSSKLTINYHLLVSPIYCGREFNKQLINVGCEPISSYRTNAFAWYPNIICATYNKSIKAIGCHEDTHLLAYEYFKQLSSRFITEGLAVAFDEYWQGIPVHKYSKKVIEAQSIEIASIINNNQFDSISDMITYPIAGSVCLWLIQTYGMEEMKNVYKESLNNCMYISEKYQFNDYFNFLRDLPE